MSLQFLLCLPFYDSLISSHNVLYFMYYICLFNSKHITQIFFFNFRLLWLSVRIVVVVFPLVSLNFFSAIWWFYSLFVVAAFLTFFRFFCDGYFILVAGHNTHLCFFIFFMFYSLCCCFSSSLHKNNNKLKFI